MTTHLTSTFSPAMLAGLSDKDTVVSFKVITLDKVITLLKQGFVSGIGHPATADMVSNLTGIVKPGIDPNNRVKVAARSGDQFVVAQYMGPRLKEGEIMHSPDPSYFTWLLATVAIDYSNIK